ncbi:MAG: hypothetical protein JO046_15295 [Solirubrobacterales bacterium]|nr:hypothetical protein [Solirubrobacterales bacterium]
MLGRLRFADLGWGQRRSGELLVVGGPGAVLASGARSALSTAVALIGSSGSATWEYRSADGGRSWHYLGTVRP